MTKRWLVLAACALLSLTLLSCSVKPEQKEPSYETTSGTIRLEVSGEEPISFPSERPTAQEQPPLDLPGESEPEADSGKAALTQSPVRAVWFSYLEFQSLLTGQNEQQFRANFSQALDRVTDAGLNTVFVQVRPFGDALYASELFPWSSIITGEEGKDPGFDPLAVMIELARERNLRIDAWVNPYRIRTSGKDPISEKNPAAAWEKAGSGDVIRWGEGLYYNPASEAARKLIVDGVREIVERYDVDGVQFDDYFYPTTEEAFDLASFEAYRSGGGKMPLESWRRENVNTLVREAYAAVKEADGEALFGISPQGNNDNNYRVQFIDTAKWLSEKGYVDYLCPQIYFGFENTKAPFERTLKQWNALVRLDSIELYVGLAPYKIGVEDEWAGEGKEEWKEHSDLLARMVTSARTASRYGGFSMFRYQFLFEPDAAVREQVGTELKNLKEAL